jgi:lysophospholipid acyltransferase (LPLAT)-like uncharacterized protein
LFWYLIVVFKSLRNYFWLKAEPWHSFRYWIMPRIMRIVHSLLMCTVRLSASGAGQAWTLVREGAEGKRPGVLFVTWHDWTLLPLHLFRHRNVGVMMSRSRAGQMQSAFFGLYGWPTVWGSTNKREGIQALREVLRLLRAGQSFAFTPDGPKGPRHRAQPGVIYLAGKTPTVVLPLSVAAARAWHLPTWDKYLIPKPFSRVHVHIGAPLHIPSDIPREETEIWQRRIEELIDSAGEEAQRQLSSTRAM